jgi:hypothetical protein
VTATERVVQQLNARRVRENLYRAKCPVHGGKSDSSLSIKNAGDRVLLHCHNQCDYREILAALGMTAAELFDSVKTKPDPAAERLARAWRNLEIWAQRQLVKCCELLRNYDETVRFAVFVLSQFEDGILPRDVEYDNKYWDALIYAYRQRETLEAHFRILNGHDREAKLELWRDCE